MNKPTSVLVTIVLLGATYAVANEWVCAPTYRLGFYLTSDRTSDFGYIARFDACYEPVDAPSASDAKIDRNLFWCNVVRDLVQEDTRKTPGMSGMHFMCERE